MNQEYRIYIAGEFCDAEEGRTIEIIDPATEEVIAEVPYGGLSDTRRAIQSAREAFEVWRSLTANERARPLLRTAELIRDRADDMARILTREVGKPLPESRGEIMGAAAQFEWYSEEIKRRWGEWIPTHAPEKRLFTMRMPVGITGAIAPWNFPVLLLARKLAPALACGCAVVGRPASQTPLATMEMFNCIAKAGFPPGAANLVTGPPGEIADEFMENPVVRKISFTGSVEVGKQLMKKAADRLKRISLELGGHSPFIVCDDVSMEEAAKLAVFGKFRNMGQVCISPSRFFAPRKKLDEFASLCAEKAKALKIGNGLLPDSDVGPLHDKLRLAATEALVQDIVDKGGKILCGGKRPQGPEYERGFWYQPTVASNMNADMVIMNEEPFAPILPVIGYDDLDDAIAQANNTSFGLAAYVITRDLGRAIKLSEALEAGIVGINDPAPAAVQAPFGGMKESGLGREGGQQGIDAYTEIKYVSMVV